jgi:hypothetical protein
MQERFHTSVVSTPQIQSPLFPAQQRLPQQCLVTTNQINAVI